LTAHIQKLNDEAESGTAYKLIFLTRHGQGFHNLAEEKYGSPAWNNYWAPLNSDGEIQWGPDPELTQLGISQATCAHDAWKEELAFRIPLPDKMYCSPLTRAIRTHEIIFRGIVPESEKSARKTVVTELCREHNGVHTCDKRRSRSYIKEAFPWVEIEEALTEEDQLWSASQRELPAEIQQRAKKILDTIFETDVDHAIIAITAHGGFVRAFMMVLNQVTSDIPTGGVLPVLVKSSVSALN